jgi:hypothetical protein
MFDIFTGWKISVESTDTDGPYVIVPARQVDALCRVLSEHGISHAVEGEVPSHHHAEAPAEFVVRMALAAAVELEWVQDILDLAP